MVRAGSGEEGPRGAETHRTDTPRVEPRHYLRGGHVAQLEASREGAGAEHSNTAATAKAATVGVAAHP